jgi:hypothetical protein
VSKPAFRHHHQKQKVVERPRKPIKTSRKCPYMLRAIHTHSSEHTGPEKSSSFTVLTVPASNTSACFRPWNLTPTTPNSPYPEIPTPHLCSSPRLLASRDTILGENLGKICRCKAPLPLQLLCSVSTSRRVSLRFVGFPGRLILWTRRRTVSLRTVESLGAPIEYRRIFLRLWTCRRTVSLHTVESVGYP